MKAKELNVLALAYLGDAVYETHIRKYLLSSNIVKVKDLQQESIKYVSAKSQAMYLEKMLNDNFITPSELDIIHRARNHKSSHHPIHTSIIAYKWATGFEALIGKLELEGNESRILEIISYIITNKTLLNERKEA